MRKRGVSRVPLYFIFLFMLVFICILFIAMPSPNLSGHDDSRFNRLADLKRRVLHQGAGRRSNPLGYIDNSHFSSTRSQILALQIRHSVNARTLTKAGLGNATVETWKLPDYFNPNKVVAVPGVDHPLVVDRQLWPRLPPFQDFARRNATWALGPLANAATMNKLLTDYLKLFQSVVGGRTITTVIDVTDNDAAVLLDEWTQMVDSAPKYPTHTFKGRGIVIAGGGVKYLVSAYINVRMLRYLGCDLPIELWIFEKERLTAGLEKMMEDNGVRVRTFAEYIADQPQLLKLVEGNGFTFKAAALIFSSFDEVLFMDADVNVLLDPSEVFEFPPFRKTGALLWKDYWRLKWMDFRHAQKVFNLTEDELSDWSGGNTGSYLGAYEEDTPHRNRKHRPFEFTMDRIHYEHHTSKDTVWTVDSGVMLVSKQKIWRALMFYFYMNLRPEGFHYKVTVPNNIGIGDKETLPTALRVLRMAYYLGETPVGIAGTIDKGHTMVQYAPNTTQPMFLHRNCNKVRSGTLNFQEGDRTWQMVAHITPRFRTMPVAGMDEVFWKCAVSIQEEGFIRQPFLEAVPHLDVEKLVHVIGTELIRNPSYTAYQVQQSKGKYVAMFGHSSASIADAMGGNKDGAAASHDSAAGDSEDVRRKAHSSTGSRRAARGHRLKRQFGGNAEGGGSTTSSSSLVSEQRR